SVFTFHAFGTDIMGRYREYFYNGADFSAADDLARHRIITDILDSLPYDNPLRSKMNDRYTHINDILSAISDLKRAGFTDAEFNALLDAAETTIDTAGKLLGSIFENRISKATKTALENILPQIESIDESMPLEGAISLREVLANSLQHTINEAENHEKVTPPITAWKNEWMTRDVNKNQILKAQKSLPKLRALHLIYGLYLREMERNELYDYDDMIMQVVHAMEVYDDLRYDLQEKYQYIMVDEFQDTNMAQMRILHNLTNNPIVEDSPNILVVGDDDQAIYGFQGAEVSNILNFQHTYPKTTNITLIDNYRSTQAILDSARNVIIQGTERLETHLPELNKALTSHRKSATTNVELVSTPTPHDERHWVATSIKSILADTDTPPSEIAIIARKHADLISLISYLTELDIPISYDRKDNVLDDEAVIVLEKISEVIHALGVGEYSRVNALLPEVISHPAWSIEPTAAWEIGITAYRDRKHWLEVMREHSKTKIFAQWLIACSAQAQHLPLERMMDIIIGNTSIDDSYTSPYKEYFFGANAHKEDMSTYSSHLKNLSAIRSALQKHSFDIATPQLSNFLDFIDACRVSNTSITSMRHIGDDASGVQLLTAHGSKGLEFNHVFILNTTDAMWGEKANGKSSSISFLPHLRLRRNNNDYDERLRLFFVAMTRARQGLHMSFAIDNDTSKEMLLAAFLHDDTLPVHAQPASTSKQNTTNIAEHLWYAPIVNVPQITMEDYLLPILKDYKLSATHVNRFIDVTTGGPQRFIIDTLLRFPSAKSAVAGYGTAIHAALQRAHDHVRSTGSLLPEEDILHEFEKHLDKQELTDDERRDFLQKGSDSLSAFLRTHHGNFTKEQFAELNFAHQDVAINDALLTGKIDVVSFNKEDMTATVTDYKTGSTLTSWEKGLEYQKIKAHKYRQQLLFYKLLIENSRDWRRYTMTEGILQFVEPDAAKNIVDLKLQNIEQEEVDRFKKLIEIIWKHIMALDFPDTSHYDNSIAGIRQFEEDLLNNLES
ncbi:ATP-dependent helicase, partial [Candidatus Saccharibacteria bacterium]|nr:ATP-dependent helicase [Candidatus Saccharibacteria bacterium]